MIGTAGHVDHGKSALVKLLTGCETDTLEEEKQRGLTIDLGFAPCRLADERIVGIVDVPGHADFIRNMVAGAHGIDVVILVVAADDGVMPQTHEHLHILTLMGVRHGLVALTKIDLVDASRRAEVIANVRSLLTGTFLENAPVCPISNITGEGFESFFETLNRVADACEDRPCNGIFRMWVEDVFTIRGSGTVITGIPSGGIVRAGDMVRLEPAGLDGRVRRIQVYGKDSVEGRAGECVALNIPEISHETVKRGQILSVAGAADLVTMAEGELRILPSIRGTVKDYFETHLHIGTAVATARVAMLERTEMQAGESQLVQLRFDTPLPLAPGERFVLRANFGMPGISGIVTVGGGRLFATINARLRRHKQWTLDLLNARRAAIDDPALWAEVICREFGRPVPEHELLKASCMRPEEFSRLAPRLQGRLLRTPSGAFLHVDLVTSAAAELLRRLGEFHTSNPQRAGMTPDELRVEPEMPAELFRMACDSLLASGKIEHNGAVISRAGWRPEVADPEQQAANRIAEELRAARWAPPSAAELVERLKLPPARVDRALRLLSEKGIIVRLDEKVFMHKDAVAVAREAALKLWEKKRTFTTMEFRDALAVSRKYAVPLLDHFDRVRFTVRDGHNRTPGAACKPQS